MERCPPAASMPTVLKQARLRYAAMLFAVAGVGLSMGVPFALGTHAVLAGLRELPLQVFFILAASAVLSAAAKAGKLQLLQNALGLRLHFMRTFTFTLVTDFAFLVSPLGAAGYGVNVALLKRAGASWATAATAVGADQALDLVFFGMAVPIGFLFGLGPLRKVFPEVSAAMVIGNVLAAALAICTLWLCRRYLAEMLGTLGRHLPWLKSRQARWHRFRQNITLQLTQLTTGGSWRFVALLLLATLQWLLRYGALWFSMLELGHRLPLGFVLAVQAVVLHIALWTGVPAGGGSGDLALTVIFAPWISSVTMAMALVLWRFATLYCPLILGAIGSAVLAGWRIKPQVRVPE